MRLVRKYPLALQKEQEVTLPNGATPKHCAAIGDVPYIWAIVDPDAPMITCVVTMFETGETFQEWSEDLPDGFRGDYLGTVILSDGRELHFVRRVP